MRSLLGDLLLFTITLSLCGFCTPASNAQTRADGPEAVMASTKRDFGDVFAGEELEQNFPVRNAGTKPLMQRSSSATASDGTCSGMVPSPISRAGFPCQSSGVAPE